MAHSEDIGARLDALVIDIMELQEEATTLRQTLDAQMKDGFFEMARARYRRAVLLLG